MIVAHIPAGYLLSSALPQKGRFAAPLWWAVLCSVLPDLDMLYFFWVDQRQNPHHSYPTHIPIFWCGLYLLLLCCTFVVPRGALWRPYLHVMILCLLGHLVLDTVFSGICWLYPLSDGFLSLWPAQSRLWVLSYSWPWSLGVEGLFVLVAVLAFVWHHRCGADRLAVVTLWSRG